MRTILSTLVIGLCASSLFLAGCKGENGGNNSSTVVPPKDIVETAKANGLSTLTTAVNAAELTSTLKSAGPFTVFAPTNGAFSALPSGTLDSLLLPANKTTLAAVLKYHVLSGSFSSTQVLGKAETGLTTVQGPNLLVDQVGSNVYINQAKVLSANVLATNGTVHVIDQVLTPPTDIVSTLRARGNFTRLINAVETADLTATVNATGQKTLLAPTDAAFNAIIDTVFSLTPTQLRNILAYHLIPDSGVKASVAVTTGAVVTAQGQSVSFTLAGGVAKVNGVTISVINIPATNGVIHVIDAVLIPTPGPSSAGRFRHRDTTFAVTRL